VSSESAGDDTARGIFRLRADQGRIMTAEERESILPEIVQRLAGALQPERIYLFGSHARGQAGPLSDLDLLVVVPHSDQPGYKRDGGAYRALRGIAVAIDVLVWTHAEFERGLRIRTSLSSSVQRTGRLLYAA